MATYDKPAMQKFCQLHAEKWWKIAYGIWGNKIGNLPVVEVNSRLTATGGRAFMLTIKNRKIFPGMVERMDFSCYLLERNRNEYANQVIPHECAHFIAMRVYGDENHGHGFYEVMSKLGCRIERCHPMVTKYQADKKRK